MTRPTFRTCHEKVGAGHETTIDSALTLVMSGLVSADEGVAMEVWLHSFAMAMAAILESKCP